MAPYLHSREAVAPMSPGYYGGSLYLETSSLARKKKQTSISLLHVPENHISLKSFIRGSGEKSRNQDGKDCCISASQVQRREMKEVHYWRRQQKSEEPINVKEPEKVNLQLLIMVGPIKS